MPELPEVETIRLQLQEQLPGKKIHSIVIINPRSFLGGSRYLVGKKILRVRRFAKMLAIDFEDEFSVVVHLKMTGQLLYKSRPNKHTRVILKFLDGTKLFFDDQRKFGWMKMVRNDDWTKKLGPDALNELTVRQLENILKKSKRPIKLVLMDQSKIGGIGNIYANDALFLSRINPSMRANTLSIGQMVKLLESLKKVLKDGIKWKGASRNHFRDIYGNKGLVQDHFYIYDREGRECPNNCGNKIKKIKLGGRGTFFCPNCQA